MMMMHCDDDDVDVDHGRCGLSGGPKGLKPICMGAQRASGRSVQALEGSQTSPSGGPGGWTPVVYKRSLPELQNVMDFAD